jgi:hypothetical protein
MELKAFLKEKPHLGKAGEKMFNHELFLNTVNSVKVLKTDFIHRNLQCMEGNTNIKHVILPQNLNNDVYKILFPLIYFILLRTSSCRQYGKYVHTNMDQYRSLMR